MRGSIVLYGVDCFLQKATNGLQVSHFVGLLDLRCGGLWMCHCGDFHLGRLGLLQLVPHFTGIASENDRKREFFMHKTSSVGANCTDRQASQCYHTVNDWLFAKRKVALPGRPGGGGFFFCS